MGGLFQTESWSTDAVLAEESGTQRRRYDFFGHERKIGEAVICYIKVSVIYLFPRLW